MAARSDTLKRRRWADIVVLVAAAYALSAAAWFPPELAAGGTNEAVAAPAWLWIAYASAGILGFIGVFAASKSVVLGKILVAAAGLIMLGSFLTMASVTTLAVLSIGGTGLALLIGAAFVGPMPSPREERAAQPGH